MGVFINVYIDTYDIVPNKGWASSKVMSSPMSAMASHGAQRVPRASSCAGNRGTLGRVARWKRRVMQREAGSGRFGGKRDGVINLEAMASNAPT